MSNLTQIDLFQQLPETKQCKKCGEWKPLVKFQVSKACVGGRQHTCRKCSVSPEAIARAERNRYDRHKDKIKARVKRWKEENPERRKQTEAAYYRNNKEKHLSYGKKRYNAKKVEILAKTKAYKQRDPERWKVYNKEYQIKNAERLQQQGLEYRAKNRDRIIERYKEWRRNNQHIRRACEHRREARKKNVGGRFTAKEWLAICEKYQHRCLCCGEQKPLTIDHVVPISKGGTNDAANIQPLCLICNSRKNNKTIDYRPLWDAKKNSKLLRYPE